MNERDAFVSNLINKSFPLLFVLCCASFGQEPVTPKLPKGGVAPSPALLAGLPAEAAKIYEPIPADQNAETAYLIALSEFDAMMADCWPEEERRERKATLYERGRALYRLDFDEDRKPKTFDSEERNEVIALYQKGWDGLVEAQKKPMCRFQIGTDLAPSTPHAIAARRAGSIAKLMVLADLEKGDLNAAIDRAGVMLRLARDIQPRGTMVCQITAVAIDSAVSREIILPVLRDPNCKVEHCDRIIKLLRDHQRDRLDPFRAMLVPEALGLKSMLHDLKTKPETKSKIVQAYRKNTIGLVGKIFQSLTDGPEGPDDGPPNKLAGDRLAAMTDADFDVALKQVDVYFTRWWNLESNESADRIKVADLYFHETFGTDPFLTQVIPKGSFFKGVADSAANDIYYIGSTEALVAVKRWSLEKGSLPNDLGDAAKAAGLTEIPRDPYISGPLKLVVIDGYPVVYSVGEDLIDDGGKIDANKDRKSGKGDYITSLAPPTNP